MHLFLWKGNNMKRFKKFYVIILICMILALAAFVLFFVTEKDRIYLIVSISIFAVAFGFLLASTIYYKSIKESAYQKQRLQLWNSISYRVKNAGETSFNEMPLGIILFNDEFVIEWANNYAKKIFASELVQRNFENLNQDFANLVSQRISNFNITIYGKVFRCEHMLRDHVIYLTDISEETKISNRYKERTLALGILNLDNLDFTMSTIDAQAKSLQMSRIIGILVDWAEKNNVCIKGYSDERYILIMDSITLDGVIKNEFSILENIKNYCEKEGLRITASIGIVCDDKDAIELMDIAEDQLDLALSRGGNQAIVRRDGETHYYGAKSEAFESRTPAYVRVKTEEFIDLIKKHKNVYIQAHKDMDADAFGACLAAAKVVSANGSNPKIVLDEKSIDATVKEIYGSIKTMNDSSLNTFVSSNEAISGIKEKDLLIIVDCQYVNLLMSQDLYKKASNLAIIDHHRRNTDAISNYNFIYTLPSASSSVELIVEMLDFVDESKYNITPNEASWMIVGVLVDTNNMMFHTTYRTFNVLSKLQRCGVEISDAQKYLREDYQEYTNRLRFLNNFETVEGRYGIATCDDGIYDRAFIAKIADNLISVNKFKATFCIGKDAKDEIDISARSLEENVQVIMEKLGGGGHFTTAATQIKGITIEEAKERLISVLKQGKIEGPKGEEFVKVILLEDIKGTGKKGEVVEVANGFANHLIKKGSVEEASQANLKKHENEKLQAEAAAEKLLTEMQELKEKIESMTVKVPVKVGESGKLYGTVTTKEVCEKFKEQNGIELDRKKISYDNPIDALGTYKIPIKLHNSVNAIITLYVIEGSVK